MSTTLGAHAVLFLLLEAHDLDFVSANRNTVLLDGTQSLVLTGNTRTRMGIQRKNLSKRQRTHLVLGHIFVLRGLRCFGHNSWYSGEHQHAQSTLVLN
jgi:hypothetical protein